MKHAIIIFFVGCLMILSASCGRKQSEQGFIQISPESVQITIVVPESNNQTGLSATPTHDFAWADSRAACQFTSVCILMRVGRCENVQAIHVSQIATAEAYTILSKEQYPEVDCAPDWPIEDYDPYCLNQKCRAILRNYHMMLEVPEQPIAGEPFWVGMSFQLNKSAQKVVAGFGFPEGLNIVNGQATWSGPVEAGQEIVFWVEVQTNRVDDLYLTTWAKIQDDEAFPGVSWSEYIEVASPLSITPWPERERILPTPTPRNR